MTPQQRCVGLLGAARTSDWCLGGASRLNWRNMCGSSRHDCPVAAARCMKRPGIVTLCIGEARAMPWRSRQSMIAAITVNSRWFETADTV